MRGRVWNEAYHFSVFSQYNLVTSSSHRESRGLQATSQQSVPPSFHIYLYKHEEMVPPQPSTNSLSLWDDGGISGTTAVRLVL